MYVSIYLSIYLFFYKAKCNLTIWPRNYTLAIYPIWWKYTCLHKKNLYSKVYSSCIYYCKNSEATNMSLNKWMDEYTGIHPKEGILFINKKKWAIISKQDKTWMNLTCIFQSKSRQSENVTFLYDWTTWLFVKGKTIEIIKDELLSLGFRGKKNGGEKLGRPQDF